MAILINNFDSCCSYAGAVFADACLKGLNGVPDIVECSFVQSSITDLPFFASKVSQWSEARHQLHITSWA
jgi:malate dehydrogenase